MPSSTTTITFDKPNYLPGETVNGQVIIENSKPLKTRSVFIRWNGYSKTKVKRNPEYKHEFFKGSELVWVANGGKNEMPAGTHEYKFSFTLPKHCAPSLKRSNGQNTYKVTVEFDRPWWFTKKVVEEFRVTLELDEAHYNINKPWPLTSSLRSGWLFKSGPISFKSTTPGTLFKPGQKFDIDIEIGNNSAVTITGVKLRIMRKTHWHARPQHIPCKRFYTCPLADSQQRDTLAFYAGDRHKMELAPYSEGKFTFPITIPSEIQTPSFGSGMMLHAHYIAVRFYYKNSPFIYWVDVPIIIADRTKASTKDKGKQEELAVAPPPYSE